MKKDGGGEGDEVEEYPEFLTIKVLIQKPFLFVIRDRETGDIWFTGTVYKPTLWEEIADQYKSHSWEEYGL